ncbi:hypothetical protein IH980_03455 [Patescibacteria group bacterium]|nr:hypothetical protein [Patescibacteria group bacterium]
MRPLLTARDAIIIFSLSIVFSFVSWWMLFTTEKARVLVRHEIAESLETTETTTLTTLPSNVILPIIAYFPFWVMTFGLIRVFTNLEKRRSRIRI